MDDIFDEQDIDSDLFLEDDSTLDFDFDLEDSDIQLTTQEDEDEYFDVSDKILKLSDRLSEDIILKNIEDQLKEGMRPLEKRFNYISLFKKKLRELNKNSSIYSRDTIEDISKRVKDLVLALIDEKYSVNIGNESDFYFAPEYLDDLETIYEFLFVRHFSNLVNYFCFMINKMRAQILAKFGSSIQDDKDSTDVFLSMLRSKFKNGSDVVIIHFLSEIVDMVMESFDSAFDLLKDIANLDPYETVSANINELLENYGNGIVFSNDRIAYDKYMEPMRRQEYRNEIMNSIKIKYLEGAELSDVAE